jgi:hypothetical protein
MRPNRHVFAKGMAEGATESSASSSSLFVFYTAKSFAFLLRKPSHESFNIILSIKSTSAFQEKTYRHISGLKWHSGDEKPKQKAVQPVKRAMNPQGRIIPAEN